MRMRLGEGLEDSDLIFDIGQRQHGASEVGITNILESVDRRFAARRWTGAMPDTLERVEEKTGFGCLRK